MWGWEEQKHGAAIYVFGTVFRAEQQRNGERTECAVKIAVDFSRLVSEAVKFQQIDGCESAIVAKCRTSPLDAELYCERLHGAAIVITPVGLSIYVERRSDKLFDELLSALFEFHSIDVEGKCPIHGDARLPNVIRVRSTGRLCWIDLSEMRLVSPGDIHIEDLRLEDLRSLIRSFFKLPASFSFSTAHVSAIKAYGNLFVHPPDSASETLHVDSSLPRAGAATSVAAGAAASAGAATSTERTYAATRSASPIHRVKADLWSALKNLSEE